MERSNLQRGKIESRKTSRAVIAVVQESVVRAGMGAVGRGDEQKRRDPGLHSKGESTELAGSWV